MPNTYIHVTWPHNRREAIAILEEGGRRVYLDGGWRDALTLQGKGYQFSKPIGLTLALQNALKVITVLGMNNSALLDAIDGDGSLKRSLSVIQDTLTRNGVSLR